ncbi:BZ3500_MvSof-1268-A1-R1_Chr3-1g05974 [Microbotryum saponariae]|uniref:BZ3500_MvSof-1268-A1-R1_Chr3-1g05974 protein n=1 Tax=Microbotryum saponariae TaxID=289078 RepID=A0A2X0L3D4_9BASI|nr:BZ3500_MvSof-1268-A1-R1_Chr3-1g05974 [Microbotryum saponariae]SDA05164.1 BZ3501_MvSof-1269-A2-R1_Chr3-1g05644 [Microbotryum saponariae]
MTSNPYTAMIESLHAQVYRTPSPGFEARMIVLSVINVLLVYLVLTQYERTKAVNAGGEESYRMKQRTFWVFRRAQKVDRLSDKTPLVIPNHRTVGIFFLLMVGISSIGLCIDSVRVWIYQHSMKSSFAWRAFSMTPMFEHGWILVWANLTTFLMTTDQALSVTVPSWLVNAFFISVFIAGGTMGITANAYYTHKGAQFWNAYVALITQLKSNEAAYPDLPSVASGSAVEQVAAVQAAYIAYWKSGAYTYGPCVIMAVAILIVNVAGLSLCRVMQRQIDFNKDQLLAAISPGSRIEGPAQIALEPHVDAAESPPRNLDKMTRWIDMATFNPSKSSLKASDLRKMCMGRANTHQREKARTIIVLARAGLELMLFSMCAASLSFGVVGTLMYLAIVSNTLAIVNGPWGIFESSVYFGTWSYPSLLLLVLSILIYQAYRYRQPQGSARLTRVAAGQISTSGVISTSSVRGAKEADDRHSFFVTATQLSAPSASQPVGSTDRRPWTDSAGPRRKESGISRPFPNLWPRAKTSTRCSKSRVLEVKLVVDRVVKEESENIALKSPPAEQSFQQY